MSLSAPRHRGGATGWVLSVSLHGFLIGTAITLAADFMIPTREEPFRWQVSLIEAPPPDVLTSDLPTPSAPAQSMNETTAAADPSVAAEAPRRDTSASPAVTPTHLAPAESAPSAEEVLVADTAPAAGGPPEPSFDPHAEPLETLQSSHPLPADIPPPAIEAITESRVVQERAIMKKERIVYDPPVQEKPIRTRNMRPDYGWLAETLYGEVERLKRYPYLAKVNRWEGNVILQAVIQNDGRILEVSVAESSGHAILDRDAKELLMRASPLRLKHALHQRQIVLQVPITYRLE